MSIERNKELCSKCRGEGEVNGYLENACTCCGGGGCGPGTGQVAAAYRNSNYAVSWCPV